MEEQYVSDDQDYESEDVTQPLLRSNSTGRLRYDEILAKVGEFGPYQRRVLLLLCIPVLIVSMENLSFIFTLAAPDHRCAVPGYDNDTYTIENSHQRALVKAAVDPGSKCLIYSDFNISQPGSGNGSGPTEDCHRWVYDKSEMSSTIITEFDLVCDLTYMRATSNMGLSAGVFFGSFLFGVLADTIGRKWSLLLSTTLSGVTTLTLAFMPNIISVVVLRCLQGMSFRVFSIAFSTVVEIVGPAWRASMGMGSVFGFCAGEFLVIPLAYFARDWRLIYMVLGVSSFVGLIAVFFTPESPRWLLDKGRYEEAEVLINKIARENKKVLPPGTVSKETLRGDKDQEPQLKIWEMFKYRQLVVRTLIIFYMWFAINMMYNGLTLNLDNLPGSMYLNYFLGILVETIGNIMVVVFADRLGRKVLLTTAVLTGAISCLLVILPVLFLSSEYSWVITALAMLGRLAASGSYGSIYILTSELFPTVVRNSGLAFCSIFENISAMMAPYIADLGIIVGGPLAPGLPMLVFGSVAILAGALSTQLPETLGKPLPDTIEDALQFGKNKSRSGRISGELKQAMA